MKYLIVIASLFAVGCRSMPVTCESRKGQMVAIKGVNALYF